MPAVFGSQHQGLPRSNMFINRVTEVMLEKPVVPITKVGSMIIGPSISICHFRMGTVGPHGLHVFCSYGIPESAFMPARIYCLATGITHRLSGRTCLRISGQDKKYGTWDQKQG